MRRRTLLAALLLAVAVVVGGCGSHESGALTDQTSAKSKHCSIVNRGRYYDVVLDYSGGVKPRTLGREYGGLIKRVMPDFEAKADSYLAQLSMNEAMYQIVLGRIAKLKPQIDAGYRNEVEGIAAAMSGGATDVRGDGKLSVNECYALSLVPDVARTTQCSAVSVFGARSATGGTITARLFDWTPSPTLARLQAVTTIRNGSRSVALIGFLGCQSMITGFSDNGIFAAMLDSPTGYPYPDPTGRRSYAFDLRHALETTGTIEAAAGYLSTGSRQYCFNHLILFSDSRRTKVLENDFVSGGPRARTLRTSKSPLNPGVSWGIGNALGCVNSFVLLGNFDNHTPVPDNTGRWASIKRELRAKGSVVTKDQLKAVAAYHANDLQHPAFSDLYTSWNQMIVIAEPGTMQYEVAFRPRNNVLPEQPVYTAIQTHF